jgi:hypothetical protein
MEQEARYYEFVARQPFKNIDVLTEAYKQIIISRAMAKISPALKKLSDGKGGQHCIIGTPMHTHYSTTCTTITFRDANFKLG